MEILLTIFLWAGLTVLIVRLSRDSQIWRQGHDRRQGLLRHIESDDPELRWVPPAKDVDPVCDKVILTEKAKPSVYAGMVYYFCSRECREIFEATPNMYVEPRQPDRTELGQSPV